MLRFKNNNIVSAADTSTALISPNSYLLFRENRLNNYFTSLTFILQDSPPHRMVSLQITRECIDGDKRGDGNFTLNFNNISGEITAANGIQYSMLFMNPHSRDQGYSIWNGTATGTLIAHSMESIQNKCMRIFEIFPMLNEAQDEKRQFGKILVQNIESGFDTVIMSISSKSGGQQDIANGIGKIFKTIELAIENALTKHKNKELAALGY